MQRKRLICTVGVILFFLATNGVVAESTSQSSTPDSSTCEPPEEYIPFERGVSVPKSKADVNATVTRVNNSSIRFTYHNLNSDEEDFGPSISGEMYAQSLRVSEKTGFSIVKDEHGVSLFWDSTDEKPSVTLTADQGSGGKQAAREIAIQPEWVFIQLPQHSRPTNVSLEEGQNGVVLDQFVILGDFDRYEREVGCQTIELYLPSAIETTEPPSKIADSLKEASQHLTVGWKYETVRVIGVGSPIRRGGRAYTHEVWVNTATDFTPPSPRIRYPPQHGFVNVWLHEYVHTRQRWGTDTQVADNARWLTEAIPSYYAISETERQGRMSAYDEWRYWETLNQSLRFSDSQTRLTDYSAHDYEDEDYTRGAYVLASLDAKIRSETNGEKSLNDVFFHLNQVEEVNHSTFRSIVIEVGGIEMGAWIDQYVDDTSTPPSPEPSLWVYIDIISMNREYQVVVGLTLILTIFGAASLIRRSQADG